MSNIICSGEERVTRTCKQARGRGSNLRPPVIEAMGMVWIKLTEGFRKNI